MRVGKVRVTYHSSGGSHDWGVQLGLLQNLKKNREMVALVVEKTGRDGDQTNKQTNK